MRINLGVLSVFVFSERFSVNVIPGVNDDEVSSFKTFDGGICNCIESAANDLGWNLNSLAGTWAKALVARRTLDKNKILFMIPPKKSCYIAM